MQSGRIMENGNEVSKTVATFIVPQQIYVVLFNFARRCGELRGGGTPSWHGFCFIKVMFYSLDLWPFQRKRTGFCGIRGNWNVGPTAYPNKYKQARSSGWRG